MVARPGTTSASAAAWSTTPPAAPAASPGTAVLGTFTFLNTTTAPFDQLTLADVQQYTQPISFGITQLRAEPVARRGVRAGQHPRRADDLTLDARPALRPADADRRDEQLRAARRLRLASRTAIRGPSIRGGYGMYYTQIRSNLVAGYAAERARRLHDLHRDARAARLPDLPDRAVPAAVVRSEDAAAVAAAGARHHDPGGPARTSTRAQFAQYGLNFDLLPNYPDEFVNPRSQVMSIGAEREVMKGLFVGARLRAPALDQPRSHGRSERAVAVRSHGARADADAWPRPMPRGRSCR